MTIDGDYRYDLFDNYKREFYNRGNSKRKYFITETDTDTCLYQHIVDFKDTDLKIQELKFTNQEIALRFIYEIVISLTEHQYMTDIEMIILGRATSLIKIDMTKIRKLNQSNLQLLNIIKEFNKAFATKSKLACEKVANKLITRTMISFIDGNIKTNRTTDLYIHENLITIDQIPLLKK